MRCRLLSALCCVFVCFFLATSKSLAASMDINLHSDALRLTFAKAMERNLVSDLGALFLDERGGGKNKDKPRDSEVAVHAGLHLVNKQIRFGVRAFYISPGDSDFLAVGFGGQGNMSLSRTISLSGHFYYAPEATSFIAPHIARADAWDLGAS